MNASEQNNLLKIEENWRLPEIVFPEKGFLIGSAVRHLFGGVPAEDQKIRFETLLTTIDSKSMEVILFDGVIVGFIEPVETAPGVNQWKLVPRFPLNT